VSEHAPFNQQGCTRSERRNWHQVPGPILTTQYTIIGLCGSLRRASFNLMTAVDRVFGPLFDQRKSRSQQGDSVEHLPRTEQHPEVRRVAKAQQLF
jgi:hypothetical protein